MKFAIIALFTIASSVSAAKTYLDMHAHVACFGIKSDCYIGQRLRSNRKQFKRLQFAFGINEDEIRKHPDGDFYAFEHISNLLAQSTRVKSSILLAFDQVYDLEGNPNREDSPFYVPNDFVFEGTKKYENLHYAASVHPNRRDAIQELERVAEQGAWMVKLIPSMHKFNPDNPRYDAYWRKLAELQLPLVIHLDDEGTFKYQSEEYTGAYKIERALELGVIVIAAHVSTSGKSHVSQRFAREHRVRTPKLSHYEQLRFLAQKYENLFVDISALPQFPHRTYILGSIATDPVWQGRMLYGSDFPLNHWGPQSMYWFMNAWELWRSNGVDPKEFWRIGFPHRSMEQRWDRDIRLKEGFGIKEETLQFSNEFFEEIWQRRTARR